ncbi:nuclear transport factor 2 family protein [Pseudanabaena sp. FACHB-2040]|uniref:nuclear transport factor 2 family protein n=1 Tax=Pseudanabaena sp. FACHB-2040 TaxID=2692859 RepID=UPI0016841402|nr:nuclear transport factor 2 family protein [Pseudanabaena sp. FACHB-2040]MBD0267994.1 nuclear transport factor 2 family protein [Cyanobacteria bacterium Co-bin8]MBD2260281.1 nuclear transport factor 2 family protein [Pseudanabaena sp. FACHB-2040]
MTSTPTQGLLQLQVEPVVQTYFTAFNQGDFAATAALFAAEGELRAPFEEPISGREAIEAYLQEEASNMQASPQEMASVELGELRQVIVKGTVRAIIFNVNVRWTFLLNNEDEIVQAEVKLLASLQELMSLRSESEAESN